MTLADFARSIGISPATARQWKKRGKIVERDSGFELATTAAKRDSLIGAEITDGSGATSKVTGVKVDRDGGVTVSAESLTLERSTPIAVNACECGKLQCEKCGPVYGYVNGKGWRIPTLARPCLAPEEEALHTAENLAGLPNSIPLPGLVDDIVVMPDPSSWGPYVRSSSGASPERIAELREKFAELKAKGKSCAECKALQERVTACERDNATLQRFIDGLRDRLAECEQKLGELERGIDLLDLPEKLLGHIDVRDADRLPRVHAIDPPGPNWGA